MAVPTIQKVGDSWRVQAMRKRIRRSKTFRSLAKAQAWAAQFSGAPRNVTTLADALRVYAAKVAPTKRGKRWELVRVNKFLRDLPFVAKPIDRITPDDLSEWRDQRTAEASSASAMRELALLSAVFQWARLEKGWVESNPCHSIRWPKAHAPRKRRVTPDDVKAILDALGWNRHRKQVQSMQDQVAVAFLLAIETAMRAGELMSLDPEQVFLDRRYVHLTKTKNGDERDVPLSNEAVRLLKMLVPLDGRMFQLSSASLDTLFRRARDKAGLDDLHFHDTRREGVSRLSKRLEVFELAAMTGHRDLKVLLKTYYSPEPMVAAKKLG
jgi:integrase